VSGHVHAKFAIPMVEVLDSLLAIFFKWQIEVDMPAA